MQSRDRDRVIVIVIAQSIKVSCDLLGYHLHIILSEELLLDEELLDARFCLNARELLDLRVVDGAPSRVNGGVAQRVRHLHLAVEAALEVAVLLFFLPVGGS